jgi:hypothetical protein
VIETNPLNYLNNLGFEVEFSAKEKYFNGFFGQAIDRTE